MVNIQDLIDDAKCYETVRTMRWPDGVSCPHCSSAAVIRFSAWTVLYRPADIVAVTQRELGRRG